MYALKAYENNGKPIDKMLKKDEVLIIIADQSMIGKKYFLEAVKYIFQQNEDILVKTPIFEFPITLNMMYHLVASEEFKGRNLEELKAKLNKFPVQMSDFVKSQRIIVKKFKETLEVRWIENIARKIEKIVYKEFEIKVREVTRKTLNPFVLKIFELVRLF